MKYDNSFRDFLYHSQLLKLEDNVRFESGLEQNCIYGFSRTLSPSRIREEEHAATGLATDDVMFAESGFHRYAYGFSRTRSPSRIREQEQAATGLPTDVMFAESGFHRYAYGFSRTRSPSRIREQEQAATGLPTDVMFAESGILRNAYGFSRTRSPSRIAVHPPAATAESATADWGIYKKLTLRREVEMRPLTGTDLFAWFTFRWRSVTRLTRNLKMWHNESLTLWLTFRR